MTAIEAKLDALMNKLGNRDKRMHSTHEVGIVEGSEEKSITDEGLVHEGPYQVEEAQFVGGKKLQFQAQEQSSNLLHTSIEEPMEHSKAKDLCKTMNNSMLHMGYRDNNSRSARELRIKTKGGSSLLRSRC